MADFMQVIADESERFLEVVQRADPAAAVPTCPDWTAHDLLWHLTEVHAFWTRILRSGARTDEDSEAVEETVPQRPSDREALVAMFREETAALLDELEQRADDEPAWFWLDTARTVGSTRRMQAHEVTMHRVDAELTAGVDSAPIAPDLAADGVAHGVTVMWGWWATLPGFEFRPTGGAVALTASDVGSTWRVQPGRWTGVGESGTSYDEPGLVLVEGGAVDPDDGTAVPATADETPVSATVEGTAEELMRWLWGRGPEPRTDGDAAALDALREAQRVGMQ